MTPNKLPPLPEPEFIRPDRPFKIFTADQMLAYGKLCSAEAFQLYVDANEARIDAEKALRQSQSLPAGAVAWRVEWTADDEGDPGFVTLDRERGARGRADEAITEGFQGVVVRPLVYAPLQADATAGAVAGDALDRAVEAFDDVYEAEYLATGATDNRRAAIKAALESYSPDNSDLVDRFRVACRALIRERVVYAEDVETLVDVLHNLMGGRK